MTLNEYMPMFLHHTETHRKKTNNQNVQGGN